MKLFATTLAAAAFGASFAFTLDTSSMTGNLNWNHANGSVAGAGIKYIATGSQEWNDAFALIASQMSSFYYEDPPGTPQSYVYPTTVVNGGDLPGLLTVNDFGIYDYGLYSGTPVVGLMWDFTADAVLQAAIPGSATPLDPIPAAYNMFQGGWMQWDALNVNTPGSSWNFAMDSPFQDVNALSDNYGWIIVPPSFPMPNGYQNKRTLLFGSLDLSDPDPANHRLVLYDGVEMSLDARLVPEPASMTALALGALGLMTRRKRKA